MKESLIKDKVFDGSVPKLECIYELNGFNELYFIIIDEDQFIAISLSYVLNDIIKELNKTKIIKELSPKIDTGDGDEGCIYFTFDKNKCQKYLNESYNKGRYNMKTVNNFIKISESYNIKNSDRLRNDIVSEYVKTLNSIDSIDESIIVKDINALPLYHINEGLFKKSKKVIFTDQDRRDFVKKINIFFKQNMKKYNKNLGINYNGKDIIAQQNEFLSGDNNGYDIVWFENVKRMSTTSSQYSAVEDLCKDLKEFINDDRLEFDIDRADFYFIYFNIKDFVYESTITNSLKESSGEIVNKSYAIDLDSLKYIVQNEQCSLEESGQRIIDVNGIDNNCDLYCILPENINENMSLESFINLNHLLTEAGFIPTSVRTYNIDEFVKDKK